MQNDAEREVFCGSGDGQSELDLLDVCHDSEEWITGSEDNVIEEKERRSSYEYHAKRSSVEHKKRSLTCPSLVECKTPVCESPLPYPVYDAYPIPAKTGMIYVAKVVLFPSTAPSSPIEKTSRLTASSESSCSDTYCAPLSSFSISSDSIKESVEYRSLCYV